MERPIGILSFFYRIYARLHRVEVLEWEESLDKEWDAAIRNNSALQEAITQMLFDEAAIRAGKTVMEIYLDIKIFYDHISWYKLLWHAASQNFPLPPPS